MRANATSSPKPLFYTGNVVFANMAACREFAHRMNQVRDVENHPDQAIHAGALYAMGLIDEASHVLIARYREQFDPEVMNAALDWFSGQVGRTSLDDAAGIRGAISRFARYQALETPKEWLAGKTGNISHRAAALEELTLLWTANRNPAFRPFEELFEDARWRKKQLTARSRSKCRSICLPAADSAARRQADEFA